MTSIYSENKINFFSFAKIKDLPKTRNVTDFVAPPKYSLGIGGFKNENFLQKDVVLLLFPYQRFLNFLKISR